MNYMLITVSKQQNDITNYRLVSRDELYNLYSNEFHQKAALQNAQNHIAFFVKSASEKSVKKSS